MQYNKILSLAISLCLLESTSALAITSNASEADMASSLQKLTAQTEELQQEIASLKTELNQVKQSRKQTKSTKQTVVAEHSVVEPLPNQASRYTYAPTIIHGTPHPTGSFIAGPNITHTASGEVSGYVPGQLISGDVAINNIGQPILTVEQQNSQERTADIKYLLGAVVLSSPILNIHSSYDASDLIVNQSTMNEDLRFLQQREELEALVGSNNLPSFNRPQVFLSGKVEPQFNYFDPFGGVAGTSIDMGSAEFDVLAEASPWAFGYLSFNFENNPLRNPLTIGSGNAVNNSRVFLKRGFITIGNLDKSPFYFSMGQEYVPFGNYSSYMLSNPLTLSEGRIDARAAVLGYFHKGLYLSGYVLNGAANTVDGFDANHVYEWGSNAGYKFSSPSGRFSGDFGAGYINNIAEAQGYQLNGLGSGFFQGFSARTDTENLQHPVGGFDAHFEGSAGNFTTNDEFITATEKFSTDDLTFNGEGAQPSALHIEGAYTIKNIFETDRNLAIFLAYDHSWQSLALNLPRNSYTGGLSTSLWKNTIEALELRHDTNYSSSTTASGICDPDGDGAIQICPVDVFGPKQNSIIAQIGVYF